MRHRNFVFAGALLAIIGVSATTAYFAAGATGLSVFEEESPVAESDSPEVAGSALAICVQAVDGQNPAARLQDADVLENAAKERVEAALPELAQHPYFSLAKYDQSPVVVDIGCPSTPLPARTGGEWYHGEPGPDVPILPVAERTPYRTFLFIVPTEAMIQELVGHQTKRVASQEFTCEYPVPSESICSERSQAIYVTEDEVGNLGFDLADLLADGAGLK